MSKNSEKMSSVILKMSSDVLFCPQPRYSQFTGIEDKRKQNIFTLKRNESEDLSLKPINQ